MEAVLASDFTLKELEILDRLVGPRLNEHWRLTAQSRTQAEQAHGQELTALRDKIRDAIRRRKIIKNDVPGVR